KQMKMLDLHRILCDGKFGKVLDFCKKDLPETSKLTSILFDANQPVDISFENNRIKVTLNAIYQLHRKTEPSPDGSLFTSPEDPEGLTFGHVPYAVEFVYD